MTEELTKYIQSMKDQTDRVLEDLDLQTRMTNRKLEELNKQKDYWNTVRNFYKQFDNQTSLL